MTTQERNEMLLANKGVAYMAALRLYAKSIEVRRVGTREDVMQESLLGLMKAIDYFDPAKGFKFSTFAYSCVTRHLLTAASEKGLVRVPRSTKKLYEGEQASAERRRTAEKARRALEAHKQLPRDLLGRPEDDGESWLLGKMEEALGELPPPYRDSLVTYYGLFGAEKQDGAEAGKREGVTKQAMNTRRQRAKEMLRERLAREMAA